MPKKTKQQATMIDAIDPIFKQVLTEEITPLSSGLETEVEVSRLPRTIDALIQLKTAKELQRVCSATPFFYFLQYNQVEFKGREDPLTVPGLHLIRGRTELYLGEQRISEQKMTVTIVCAGKPRAVIAYEENLRPFRLIEAGYYKNDAYPPVYLIVVNELPVIPKNHPLLLFASNEQKFREFLEQVIAVGENSFLRYAYKVRPTTTRETLTMARFSSISREDLKFMAEDIGRDLMEFLPPKERLAGISPEERLADISDEELLKAIDSGVLMRELSPEYRKILHDLLVTARTASLRDKKAKNGTHSPDTKA